MRFDGVVVSCEHASARVPPAFRDLLCDSVLLGSHRGSDLGAARAARVIARALGAPLFLARYTRLLVDLNRSVGHPRLMSPPIAALPAAARARIIARYHQPHRDAVTAAVRAAMGTRGRVLHLAVHSFAPVMDGKRRNADVGLLYDPSHRLERALGLGLRAALTERLGPGLRVRCNYPYRGVSDGLCTVLRATLPRRRYVGLELELNQEWTAGCDANRAAITRQLGRTLADVTS